MNSIQVLLFNKVAASAEIPFSVKSLASTVAGSSVSLTSTRKTVVRDGLWSIAPQGGLVTEQGAAVSEAALSRNVMIAMINVMRRAIFILH